MPNDIPLGLRMLADMRIKWVLPVTSRTWQVQMLAQRRQQRRKLSKVGYAKYWERKGASR